MEKKFRNSSFELLRIVSMFLVFMGYMSAHGIKHVTSTAHIVNKAWLSGVLFNRLVLCVMDPGGRIGVMCFFMLTGYFLYNNKIEIGIGWLKRLLPLIMQVLFYSSLIFCSGVICYIFCN